MGDKVNGRSRDARASERWHPVSSPRALVSAAVAALGVLTPIYLATNTGLSGMRFLLAIALATCAVLLIVEGINRTRASKPWRPPIALGVAAAAISLTLVLVPTSQSNGNPPDGGLRFSLRPTPPELFHLAFREPIPWPKKSEGWAKLHRRGGIDVSTSRFHLILANEGQEPISILKIQAELLESEPMPHGTLAYHYSQGEEGTGRLGALLSGSRRGTVAPLYKSPPGGLYPDSVKSESPYFQAHYILLKPGEVYPASLTIRAEAPRTIRYRLTAEGESAQRRFVVHSPVYEIVGRFDDRYQTLFTRYYVKGHDPSVCTPTPSNPWVDADHDDRFSACPHGLGGSYEKQPPSSSEYLPGDLQLSLGLDPKQQSATIDGVVVGAKPAAVSIPGVVKPLLRSLGAWDRCSVFFPSTSYWTADWERLGLRLIFDSEGDDSDCTATSGAGVREIELEGTRATVETDLGPIEVGAPMSRLPPTVLQEAKDSETFEYERNLIIPGVYACGPSGQTEARFRLDGDGSAGIATLAEYRSTGFLDGLSSTLPKPC